MSGHQTRHLRFDDSLLPPSWLPGSVALLRMPWPAQRRPLTIQFPEPTCEELAELSPTPRIRQFAKRDST